MTMFINHFNHRNFSESYVHRLMKKLNIKSKIRRARSGYHKTKPEFTTENILNREFISNGPNQKWLTDITEFKVIGTVQKVFLSAIFDLFDKTIVSFKMASQNTNQLVFSTFDEAMKLNPHAKPLFHSDRGFQYTNRIFKVKLTAAGMIQSMSRPGRCIDNGPMEGFWGILKSEMYYLRKFHDIETLKMAITEYIDFYNNWRLQKNLKGLTPVEYRNQAFS